MPALAVITGASRGIGKAIAHYFAKQAYDLVLIARTESDLSELATALQAEYAVSVDYYALDVSEMSAVQACVDDILKTHQTIDVLVNSAGILQRGSSGLSPEDLSRMLSVNMLGIHHFVHALVPKMKAQQSGYIFNLASYAGQRPLARSAAYCMSKYGVLGYSKSLSLELVGDNIKVTAICPSVVDTDMTQHFDMPNEEKIQTSDIIKSIDYLLGLSVHAYVDELTIKSTYLLKAEK